MVAIFLSALDSETDKDNFLRLYNTYNDLLYWIADKKTKSVEDAEECVQETFLYVAKNFDKIDDVDSNRTKCYLATIVTGFAIDIYNKSKKELFVSTDDENNSIEIEYFENYEKTELTLAIDNVLDEESRVFFYLKYVYGYKSKEIADMYNVKDTYVRKKLQYAREKLRNELDERDFL